MLVNKAALTTLYVSMSAIFNNAFDAAPSQWQEIAMLVPSTTATNDYSWLSNFPQMKKWIDEKAIKSLAAFKYSIENEDWETTVEVDRNHIEDDQYGIYKPQAMMAGESAKQLPDEIVFDLVNKAFDNKCYDGKAFFATDHKVGKTTASNKGTKKLSIATLAAAQASYGAARIALMKLKSDEGRSLNIKPNILLVPPALADIANALMTVDRLEDGKSNIYKGAAKVVVDNRLTSDDAWFLLDTTKAIKPFIYQERKKPTFVSQTDLSSDDVFSRKKFKFGAEARAAGGYGFWQLAYGSDGSVA
ncbi:Mu-like prophage major head subunit gpT family protein [Agitococcus lubricus]|uniref:Mu-like prophage major head subunit gpT n=1 Tax=Agitococcus lubricus TaxID=1077255 RepID=A0A2T5J3Z1_9GAMM|nr:Mu-like prophage major head subunit gpT family protein [Agitococcus lubricus]PTQ91268.1 Mu-like prophage major head subunit gpT [Agitococcus lubricus]